MKEHFPKGRVLRGIPFLLAATLFTLPLAATQSKYVWEEEIPITLSVQYPDTVITSILLATPLVDCRLEGTGLQIQETENFGQWLVVPEQGYGLPEFLMVKIGDTEYLLSTNGGEQPAGITFDPAQGLLTISLELLPVDGTGVTVIADGVPQQATPVEQPVQQATPAPAPTPTPAAGQSQNGDADKEPATEATEQAAGEKASQQTPPVTEADPPQEPSAANDTPSHQDEKPTATPQPEPDATAADNTAAPSTAPTEGQNGDAQVPAQEEGAVDALPTPVPEPAPIEEPLSTETAPVVENIPAAGPTPSAVTEADEGPAETIQEAPPTPAVNSDAPMEAGEPADEPDSEPAPDQPQTPAPEPCGPIQDNPTGTDPLPE